MARQPNSGETTDKGRWLAQKSEIHRIDSTQFSAVSQADFMAMPGTKVDGTAGFTLAPYATARISPVI